MLMHKFLLASIAALAISGLIGPASASEPAPSSVVTVVTNSIGLKLTKIPAGEFLMGNHESIESMRPVFSQYEPRRFNYTDEYPAHKVRITRSFYLGCCTVTVGQFKQFCRAAGYQSEAERDGTGGYGYNADTKTFDLHRNAKHNWRDPGFPQTDEHPVVDVSWNDAVAFCQWLSKKEGRTYRLPTEAEWEYACRAGTTTRYWAGDDLESLVKIANLYDATTAKVLPDWSTFALKSSDGFVFTAPVGSFRPNPFGLYDMHGNAWQWVSDFYGEDYYAHSPTNDPQGPPPAERHVRRGGGWLSWPLYVRASFRNYNTPQSRYFNLSFRVARDVR